MGGIYNATVLLLALAIAFAGVYLGYWVTRLAVRHALRDVGIRGFVIRTEDEPRVGRYGEPLPPPGPGDGRS